jgi:serine/threonine protein kinase
MIRQFNIIRKIGNRAFLLLGEGSFGAVYLVKRSTDNNLYALKRVRLMLIK